MAYTKLKVVNSVLKKGVHYMTSDYKTRNKKRPNHNGIDMIGKYYAKDDIVSIDKGEVINAKYDSSKGYFVEVKHTNGYISVYYHLKEDSFKVKKGDKVVKGQVLGYMGNTGASRGAHLHFGVKTSKGTYVDPKPYLMGEKTFDVEPKTKTDVIYQSYDNDKKDWLGEIKNYNTKNSNGYSGRKGHDIGGIRVKLSDGSKITIQTHIRDGKKSRWLNPISKWDNTSTGYSGIKGKPIDAVMIKADKHKIKYRVFANGRWYNWITGFNKNDKNNGYAGVIGKDISAIQIQVVE